MKELIDSTRSRLDQGTLLKYIDENWGQIEYVVAQPVKWPCALISIFDGQFSDIGIDRSLTPNWRQMAEYTVELRIAHLKLSPSSAKATATMKQNSLSIFDVLQEVHDLLHGWTPGGNFGRFIRKRMQQVKRDDGVQEYVVYYTVGVSSV